MAVGKNFKQDSMGGLSARTQKSGYCREVAVRGGLTVNSTSEIIINCCVLEIVVAFHL